MLDKDGAARLLAYTSWANHRALRMAATLSPDDYKRDLRASHGGVRGTLTHMLWAEWVWLERWKGLPTPPKIDEAELADVVALRDRWTALEEHRRSWLETLRPEALGEDLRYATTEGKVFVTPLWQLVQHVANHATYHRGQVVAMVRQLGGTAVSTDMVAWDRERR